MRSGSARKAWIASLAVALGFLVAAPGAQAAIGFGPGLSAEPADTQAGANSDFAIEIPFTGSGPEDSVRDMTVHLPPGLIGNPTATPLCTVAQFESDAGCDPASQVGSVTANVDLCVFPSDLLPCISNPLAINGSLYNLEPQPGEPARFGIILNALPFDIPVLGDLLLPPIKQQSAVELREDDLGLDTVLTDTPNTARVLELGLPGLPALDADIQITSLNITLLGNVGGKAFMRNPTSCKEHVVGFDAVDHSDESATGQATFTTTGCGNLPFSPELTGSIGAPGKTEPATKPPLTTVIEQAPDEAGLERAQVILPPGVTADTTALGNVCPTSEFQASSCPPSTIIGSATAQSPLLTTPLSGQVAIVEPLTPGLPNLGVDLKGPLALQLRGDFLLTPGPGNVFEGLPDIPISRFELRFDADKLVLTTRDLCEPPVPAFHADFEGHNGATLSGDFPVEVVGCNGAGSGQPTAKVKLTRSRSEHPRIKAKVKAGPANLKQFKLKLPRQLRFAKGRDFKRGAKASGGGKVGGGKRKAKVTAAGEGATKLKLRVKGKGLDRVKSIKKGKKLRFPITAKDVDGEKTKIKAKAKAR